MLELLLYKIVYRGSRVIGQWRRHLDRQLKDTHCLSGRNEALRLRVQQAAGRAAWLIEKGRAASARTCITGAVPASASLRVEALSRALPHPLQEPEGLRGALDRP